MIPTNQRDRLLSCRVACALLLLSGGHAAAQDVTEPTLKAGFVYNVARFTVWPQDAVAATAPLVLCVLGDAGVGEALAHAVRGRMLAGHNLEVLQGPSVPLSRPCHVLYVSGMPVIRAAQVVAGLQDGPVLTISDLDGFTDRGGMAQCYFEDGQLRFTVHVASTRRAHLQLSSQLLALARIK